MISWTDKRHEHARQQLIKHGRTWTILDEELSNEENAFISEVPDLLADALDEIERLRALTTITDNMVRAAAREFWLSGSKDRAWAEAAWDDMGGGEPCEERALVEIAAERALRAALNTKEEA